MARAGQERMESSIVAYANQHSVQMLNTANQRQQESVAFLSANKVLTKNHSFSTLRRESITASQQPLNELLESTVDGRTGLDSLVEINRSHGTFGDTLSGKLEFLSYS